MPAKNQRLILLAILLLAVLLRVGVALYLGDTVPTGKDEQSYSELAARLATGHGYSFDRPWYPFAAANAPTAHWSFLYTAFVAGIYAVVGVHPLAARLIQAVLVGLLLPWLTYRLARRMMGSRGAGELGGRGAEERRSRGATSSAPTQDTSTGNLSGIHARRAGSPTSSFQFPASSFQFPVSSFQHPSPSSPPSSPRSTPTSCSTAAWCRPKRSTSARCSGRWSGRWRWTRG